MPKQSLPELAAKVRTASLMLFAVTASVQLLPLLAGYICLHTRPYATQPSMCQPYQVYAGQLFVWAAWIGGLALIVGLASQLLRRIWLRQAQHWQ